MLPRVADTNRDLRCVLESETEAWLAAATGEDMESCGCEVVSADFSDA